MFLHLTVSVTWQFVQIIALSGGLMIGVDWTGGEAEGVQLQKFWDPGKSKHIGGSAGGVEVEGVELQKDPDPGWKTEEVE